MKKTLQAVSSTVQSHLLNVQKAVNAITDPSTGLPIQIPDFETLYQAAGQLDTTEYPLDTICVIQKLLGRASSVDMEAPSSDYSLSFPNDHHLHPSMGDEWYWVGAHMQVTDQNGNSGRLSIMLSMQKRRAVGLTAQQQAGWTDQEVTIANNLVTVTVDMGPDNRNIYRRNKNVQWPLKDGIVNFSTPGQNFLFECGLDSLQGSPQVLPLSVWVDDGDNMNIDLTLSNQNSIELESSFFLQGIPNTTGNGGTGLTSIPTPGIYYSWPQLDVSGSVTIQGTTYSIDSGIGWIDHQLMMSSLQNPPSSSDPEGIHPLPFLEDPTPYNGWLWQYYNLDNGQAFTGAGFILGEMTDNPKLSYGYFLVPDNGSWQAIFINGDNHLLYNNAFPAIIGNSPYTMPYANIPVVRTYENLENIFVGNPLLGVATPWHSDGTFNNPDWSLGAEFPADYTDLSGKYANGVGYLESIGCYPVADYRTFALAFLQGGPYPGS